MSALPLVRLLSGMVAIGALAVGSTLVQADPLPGGSYQQSCRNLSSDGGTLRGDCRTRDVGWVGTRLDNVHQCVGDFDNENGQLRCSRGGRPPGGSYTQSCRDIWFAGDMLHASCVTHAGNWFGTALGVDVPGVLSLSPLSEARRASPDVACPEALR